MMGGRRRSAARLALALAAALGTAAAALAATYEYDALGRLIRVTHDSGAAVDYSYDAAGNRTSVEVGASGSAGSGVIVVPLNGFTVIPLE